MGCLRVKANEFEYKERDSRLTEHIISGNNGDEMKAEIIKELATNKKTDEIMGNQLLIRGEG